MKKILLALSATALLLTVVPPLLTRRRQARCSHDETPVARGHDPVVRRLARCDSRQGLVTDRLRADVATRKTCSSPIPPNATASLTLPTASGFIPKSIGSVIHSFSGK